MKAFIYTIIFGAAILLPILIVTTNAIKKEPSGKDYIVTYASGICAIQYNVQHHDSALRKWHQEKGTIKISGIRTITTKRSDPHELFLYPPDRTRPYILGMILSYLLSYNAIQMLYCESM